MTTDIPPKKPEMKWIPNPYKHGTPWHPLHGTVTCRYLNTLAIELVALRSLRVKIEQDDRVDVLDNSPKSRYTHVTEPTRSARLPAPDKKAGDKNPRTL